MGGDAAGGLLVYSAQGEMSCQDVVPPALGCTVLQGKCAQA